jgi:hypothetical protein
MKRVLERMENLMTYVIGIGGFSLSKATNP